MSRSYKKPIIKDRPRNFKKSAFYWRQIRRKLVQEVKQNKEVILNPKEIVNDYNYSDYKISYLNEPKNNLNRQKLSRK